MDFVVGYLQTNIVLVLFLVVGAGQLVGKLRIGSLDLGPTTGILLVGLVIGLLHLNVPPIVKGLSFTIYLFVLGVLVGPGLVHLLSSRAVFKYLAHSLFGGAAGSLKFTVVAIGDAEYAFANSLDARVWR